MDPQQIPLRDLHLPDVIGWWPPAPGWWLLAALLVAGLFYALRGAWRHWRQDALRRLALRELRRLRNEYDRGVDLVTLTKQLSELLRRAMLAYAPRGEVAGLTGSRWLAWLDHGLAGNPFSEGPGRILVSLPYRRGDLEDDSFDIDAVTEVVRLRLRTPRRESTE